MLLYYGFMGVMFLGTAVKSTDTVAPSSRSIVATIGGRNVQLQGRAFPFAQGVIVVFSTQPLDCSSAPAKMADQNETKLFFTIPPGPLFYGHDIGIAVAADDNNVDMGDVRLYGLAEALHGWKERHNG